MAHGVGFRITKLWAYLAIHSDTDEGIIAVLGDGGTWVPAIGANKERLDDLRPSIEAIAKLQNLSVRLVEFSVRTDIETINPKGRGGSQ